MPRIPIYKEAELFIKTKKQNKYQNKQEEASSSSGSSSTGVQFTRKKGTRH